jgi:predicted choloylglycine hydrolase
LLFGRNLDFFPLGYLHEFSLVTVYAASAETYGFASVGFPGSVGCFSGMNQFGLSLARHEVLTPAVKTTYNPKGIPFAICFRAVLETCRTVAEAIRLIEKTPHVTVNNLILCDANGGAIVEIAPEGIRSRPITTEMHSCTNHFVDPAWQNPRQANSFQTQDRLARLESSPAVGVGIDDVRRVLDDVNQGDLTIQTMVFDPSAVAIHVAFGPGPTTRSSLTRIDLAQYWAA